MAENPKDSIGDNKIPIHLFPMAAVYMGALGNLEGNLKYGRNNFRAAPIRYTVYLDAIKRHADALLECEDEDPDSGLHHLCHVLAGAGILADAMQSGTLVDNRNYIAAPGLWRKFVQKLTPHVKRLKEKHADKHPRHYTINDNAEPSSDSPAGPGPEQPPCCTGLGYTGPGGTEGSGYREVWHSTPTP